MLVAAVWIGLNCLYWRNPSRTEVVNQVSPGDSPWAQIVDCDHPGRNEIVYGLPWPFLQTQRAPDGWWQINDRGKEFLAQLGGKLEPEWRFSFWPFLFDSIFALGILGMVAVVCEWHIRWHWTAA